MLRRGWKLSLGRSVPLTGTAQVNQAILLRAGQPKGLSMERGRTRQHQRCRPSVAGALYAQMTTVGVSQRLHGPHQTSYNSTNRTTRGIRTAVNISRVSLQGTHAPAVVPQSCHHHPRALYVRERPHLTPITPKLPNETTAMGFLSFAARETTRPSHNLPSRTHHATGHATHNSPPNTLSKIVLLCSLAAGLCTLTN